MRKLFFAFALLLAGSGVVWADGIPQVVDPRNNAQSPWTVTVFNDSGATIASGEIVVWDTGDADVTTSGRPYVTQSATDSDPATAGVMLNTCPDQSACDIVVLGITEVRCMDASDAVTSGDLVSNSDVDSGLCGDHTAGADNRAIGIALEAGDGNDYSYITVFVYPADGQ